MSYYATNPKRLPLIGHISLGIRDMSISKPFYEAVFKPFGIGCVWDDGRGGCTGWGPVDDDEDEDEDGVKGEGEWEWVNLFKISGSSPHPIPLPLPFLSAADCLVILGLGEEKLGTAKGTHIAFNAPSRTAVDLFYKGALENGGRGDGSPGVRGEIHGDYYACFVWDPDGNRLEAVYQQAVGEEGDVKADEEAGEEKR